MSEQNKQFELSYRDQFMSEVGKAALRAESAPTLNQEIQKRIERMTDILQTFGADLLPTQVYDAMTFYEATSALDLDIDNNLEEIIEARQNLIDEYLTNPDISNQESDYVRAILGDLSFMDNEANGYRSNPNMYEKGGKHLKAIISDTAESVDKNDWNLKSKDINVYRMKEVFNQVNLESIIIKGAQLFDDLSYFEGKSDPEIFHKIIEAESFYAPICEAIGLDAFASALRNQSTHIRYYKMELKEPIERAEAIINKSKKVSIEQILHLFSQKFQVVQMAGKKLNGEDIVNFGDFEIMNESKQVSGSYRYKTVGSIANKFNKKGYETSQPVDLIGLTFVIDNQESLVRCFIRVAKELQKSKANFITTPGKFSPFFVQASEERLNQITPLINQEGIYPQCNMADENKFQVAKMTFDMFNADNESVGVELQFLTTADRRSARLGPASHILYKLGNELPANELDELIDLMVDIHDRKQYLSAKNHTFTIKSESLARSDALFDN